MRGVAIPKVPSIEVAFDGHVRLLPARFHDPAPLVDSGRESDTLDALASLAGRLGSTGAIGALHPAETDLARWRRRCVDAAFDHPRPGGSRFNDERRGAWYSADSVPCAANEVGWHHARELLAIERLHDVLEYEVLAADFRGEFHDARGLPVGIGVLHPNPDVAYPLGQALAAALTRDGSRGLIYPSVRHDGGRCLAAFDPGAVDNVRESGRVRLVWNGTAEHELVTL